MLFGCMYGLVKSNKLRPQIAESIHKEFHMKSLKSLDAYSCLELIDATSYNNRTDYDAKSYMKNEIIPRLVDLKKHLKFLHIPKHLMLFMETLDRMKYYDSDLWEIIYGYLDKKHFYDVKQWAVFYEYILHLRAQGVEQESGFDFSGILQRYEDQWKKSSDFQYYYNLEEKRKFTIHELIERAKDTPATLTWQEGLKYIEHTLPDWYFEADNPLDEDIDELLGEYKLLKARETGKIKEDIASLFNS